ncbi:hypothetical protein D3C83_332760 [compost metagenome]
MAFHSRNQAGGDMNSASHHDQRSWFFGFVFRSKSSDVVARLARIQSKRSCVGANMRGSRRNRKRSR